MPYSALFCQSNFSFLTGASHPHELIEQAAYLNHHAIALTDECSLSGIVKAHITAKKFNINKDLPVINVSSRTHGYKDYYNDNTKKIVQTKFEKDINTFGYNFS